MDPQPEPVKGSHAPPAHVKRNPKRFVRIRSAPLWSATLLLISFCEPWLASHRSYHAEVSRRPACGGNRPPPGARTPRNSPTGRESPPDRGPGTAAGGRSRPSPAAWGAGAHTPGRRISGPALSVAGWVGFPVPPRAAFPADLPGIPCVGLFRSAASGVRRLAVRHAAFRRAAGPQAGPAVPPLGSRACSALRPPRPPQGDPPPRAAPAAA